MYSKRKRISLGDGGRRGYQAELDLPRAALCSEARLSHFGEAGAEVILIRDDATFSCDRAAQSYGIVVSVSQEIPKNCCGRRELTVGFDAEFKFKDRELGSLMLMSRVHSTRASCC
jgi:hypothetical protein